MMKFRIKASPPFFGNIQLPVGSTVVPLSSSPRLQRNFFYGRDGKTHPPKFLNRVNCETHFFFCNSTSCNGATTTPPTAAHLRSRGVPPPVANRGVLRPKRRGATNDESPERNGGVTNRVTKFTERSKRKLREPNQFLQSTKL